MSETPKSDIPPHWKYYRLYMLCPRQLGLVHLKGAEIQCEVGVWEFGKLPAASSMHAVNTFWENVAHKGPGLLNVHGRPIRSRKISKEDVLAEECEPDPQHHAVVE